MAGLGVVAACTGSHPDPIPGVALALAEHRATTVRDLRYEVHLDLPGDRTTPVTGEVTVRFALESSGQPLVLDFRAPPGHVRRVLLNGDSVAFTTPPDHIVIPGADLPRGAHAVTITFQSTDDALNRQDDFLYSLFVPDRASTTFPVFEQPDLKARFTLSLGIPAGWQALTNGALLSRDSAAGDRHRLRFAETEPISTYLFAFAAGRLLTEHAVRDGRPMTMYHRETDAARVARNRDAIFDLHAAALRWLEEYTEIAYPFGKFDFLAVPAFQFGGMEHPGAIWYRAETLFLDPSASRAQELGRASLIAHETAHMWFGDLVTMTWFNDVWMKEVFANFMAAKIAGPSFPDLNLDLRFFQAHHPAAYDVDRTPGAHPIRQPLENLREAGSLYGAIIYQKAPIVMRQLESLVGEVTFRDGLRAYLDQYRFGNAAWPDLVAILDGLTDVDLIAWSRAWVNESHRPVITAVWGDSGVALAQEDPVDGRGLRWPQTVAVAIGRGDSVEVVRGPLPGDRGFLASNDPSRPTFLLAGVDGSGYGRFPLDPGSREALLESIHGLADPLHRAVAWQALWEELLEGSLPPRRFLEAAVVAVAREDDELVATQVVGLLRATFWRWLPPEERAAVAATVEAALWSALDRAGTPARKGAYFTALVGVTLSPAGTARLERIWRGDDAVPGLPLTETQFTTLAEALAVRGVAGSEAILDTQAARISNPDRLARLQFMRRALSPDTATRAALVRDLAQLEYRRRESWVLDAIGAVNHPLRATEALPLLRPSLDLVEEIQRTGDIFFPLRWLNAVLDGHQSAEAARIVADFLSERADLPPRLLGKLLQASDDLFRSARVVNGWQGPPPP